MEELVSSQGTFSRQLDCEDEVHLVPLLLKPYDSRTGLYDLEAWINTFCTLFLYFLIKGAFDAFKIRKATLSLILLFVLLI